MFLTGVYGPRWRYSLVKINNTLEIIKLNHFLMVLSTISFFYSHRYKEFEINAINTTWDLELNKVSSCLHTGQNFKNP